MTQKEKNIIIKLINKEIKNNNSRIGYEVDNYHYEIENRKRENEILKQIKNKLA